MIVGVMFSQSLAVQMIGIEKKRYTYPNYLQCLLRQKLMTVPNRNVKYT